MPDQLSSEELMRNYSRAEVSTLNSIRFNLVLTRRAPSLRAQSRNRGGIKKPGRYTPGSGFLICNRDVCGGTISDMQPRCMRRHIFGRLQLITVPVVAVAVIGWALACA